MHYLIRKTGEDVAELHFESAFLSSSTGQKKISCIITTAIQETVNGASLAGKQQEIPQRPTRTVEPNFDIAHSDVQRARDRVPGFVFKFYPSHDVGVFGAQYRENVVKAHAHSLVNFVIDFVGNDLLAGKVRFRTLARSAPAQAVI